MSIIFIKCEDPGGDPIYEGFTISVINKTDNIYDGEQTLLVIGNPGSAGRRCSITTTKAAGTWRATQ